MFNWLWVTAVCQEWPANMCSMSCNLPVRSRWSFIPFVLPFEVGPAHFWAALYHPELSKSRCADGQKAHSLRIEQQQHHSLPQCGSMCRQAQNWTENETNARRPSNSKNKANQQ